MILSGLISKVDKLDIGKLKTGSVDLSKLSDVVKSGALKMKKYEELAKNVNSFDASGLAKKRL